MVKAASSDGLPPDDDDLALCLKAQAACELLNYNYAISLLEEVIKRNPDFDRAWNLLKKAREAKRGLE